MAMNAKNVPRNFPDACRVDIQAQHARFVRREHFIRMAIVSSVMSPNASSVASVTTATDARMAINSWHYSKSAGNLAIHSGDQLSYGL